MLTINKNRLRWLVFSVWILCLITIPLLQTVTTQASHNGPGVQSLRFLDADEIVITFDNGLKINVRDSNITDRKFEYTSKSAKNEVVCNDNFVTKVVLFNDPTTVRDDVDGSLNKSIQNLEDYVKSDEYDKSGKIVGWGVIRPPEADGDGYFCKKRLDDSWIKHDILGVEKAVSTINNYDEELAAEPTDNEPEDSCQNEGGDLSFIICPLLRMADGAFNWLDEKISELLLLPDQYIDSDGLESTWARMRNLAYIIIVPIMLFMVISTALGFEAVSAYTIKKAMPRFVIAIMFIGTSFPLLKTLIIVVNEIGLSIYGFMTGLVSSDPITLASLFNSNLGTDGLAVFIGTIALAGVAVFVSIGVLLSYAFVTILSLTVGLFLLALRQMLIIILLVMAPLAILSWIFPGNDKLWKLWWSSFSKLLLLYPLVMILIAGGRIFAFIVHDVNGADGLMQTGLKLLGVVAPYFFIPAAFKFAGGAFATLSGTINDRSRGLFDRQKKYRGAKMGQNWHDTRNSNRFNGTNALTRRANRALGFATNVDKAGLNPANWRANMTQGMGAATFSDAEKIISDSDEFKAIKDVDHMLGAAQTQTTRQGIKSYIREHGLYSDEADLDEQTAAVVRAQNAHGIDALRVAATMQKAATGTGFDTSGDMLSEINMVAGNNRGLANKMLGSMRGMAGQARRPDLAQAGMVPMMRELNAMHVDPQNHTAAVVTSNVGREALRSGGGARAILAGRTQAVAPMTTQLTTDFQAALQVGDTETALDIAGQMTALRGAMGDAPQENRDLVRQMLTGAGVETDAINADTGQAYTVDEQLGTIIGSRSAPGRGEQNLTQEIRNRAGSYDAGGGNLTPEQLAERRRQAALLNEQDQ